MQLPNQVKCMSAGDLPLGDGAVELPDGRSQVPQEYLAHP